MGLSATLLGNWLSNTHKKRLALMFSWIEFDVEKFPSRRFFYLSHVSSKDGVQIKFQNIFRYNFPRYITYQERSELQKRLLKSLWWATSLLQTKYCKTLTAEKPAKYKSLYILSTEKWEVHRLPGCVRHLISAPFEVQVSSRQW